MRTGSTPTFGMPMPGHTLSMEEREQTSAASVVNAATLTVDKAVWTEAQVKLLRRAASYPEVARIFVHPAVKKALCEAPAQTGPGCKRSGRGTSTTTISTSA